MTEFFAICDYFEITPIDFFNSDIQNPTLMAKLLEELAKLNEDDLKLTMQNVKRLLK